MKKQIKIYLAIIIVLVSTITSCDDLLETTPENYVSDQGVIVDQLSAEKALNGAYDGASTGLAYSIVTWNIAADNVKSFQGSAIVAYLQPSVGSADRTNSFAYNVHYTAINRINSVIANVNALPDSKFTGNNKQKILAQAHLLRALGYISLTQTFGAVPIVVQPSTATNQTGIKQSSRELVFGQALDDLNQAEELFGTDQSISDRGRVSIWAVYALKARLYLYTEQWEKAEEFASKLLGNTSVFGLTDEPEGFFKTAKSKESIFEYPFSNADKLPFYTYYLPSTLGGLQDYQVVPDLANKLNNSNIGGKRKQLIFRRTNDETDQVWFVNEYSKTDGSSSIQVLRLGEQYLIRAEARLKKTSPDREGAIDDIDAIKTRANVSLLTHTTTKTNSELLLEIEDERRYELAFEGHRYFDVIRTGRAPEVFGVHEPRYLKPGFWVHPFPYSTVLAYDPDLEQNEAYK